MSCAGAHHSNQHFSGRRKSGARGGDEMIGHDYNHVPALRKRMEDCEGERRRGNDLPEAGIVQQAQAGDAAAFERIYRKHSRHVYAVCMQMIRNPTEAEDLTQEVFLLVLRKIQTFRGESAFSTWLHRLAINVVLMHLRKKKLRTELLDETMQSGEEGAAAGRAAGNPEVLLTGLIHRANLKRAVELLPTAHKIVFVLHDIHGYKHHEIAEMMDSSVGTSKGQLHRARTRLRDLLRDFVHSLPSVSRAGCRTIRV
jgi:RNA polymerase sigma-70 factor, ECF subfamily